MNPELLNKVFCEDSLSFMKRLPDKCIDLVLTDPPYGIGIANNPFRQKFEKQAWDDETPSQEYFDEMERVSKHRIIWGGNYFNLPPSQCFYVWDKVQPQDFSSAMVEMAWVSRQSPAKMYKKRVVEIEKFHPTTKPVELMAWCLKFFPDAQIILDPFLGSGTTAIAAKMLGRNFIGVEKEQKYVDIANERLRVLDLQPSMF